jgi:hypothetical protein
VHPSALIFNNASLTQSTITIFTVKLKEGHAGINFLLPPPATCKEREGERESGNLGLNSVGDITAPKGQRNALW